MREILEVAEALEAQGLDVKITRKGKIKVFRFGVLIGALRFPINDR